MMNGFNLTVLILDIVGGDIPILANNFTAFITPFIFCLSLTHKSISSECDHISWPEYHSTSAPVIILLLPLGFQVVLIASFLHCSFEPLLKCSNVLVHLISFLTREHSGEIHVYRKSWSPTKHEIMRAITSDSQLCTIVGLDQLWEMIWPVSLFISFSILRIQFADHSG